MNTRLQDFVIRTSPWPPFRWAYAGVYGAALLWLVARLRAVPEIRSLELRPPRRGHCFGSSDLDLRAETAPLAAADFFALADRLAHLLLPGGTWLRIFDVYAFPEAEYELQSTLASQSSVRDRRWIRLLGRRPRTAARNEGHGVERNGEDGEERAAEPARERAAARGGDPADAHLGRATYDYAALCQDVLEGPLDLHHTRLAYGRVLRIDAELAARDAAGEGDRRETPAVVARETPAGVSHELARAILAAARAPALRGRVRLASFEALARAHALALAETTRARATRARARAVGVDERGISARSPRSRSSSPRAAPDTLDAAVRGCRPPIAELCASAGGAIRSAVLGAVPGARYEYRTYLVVRDDLTVDEHVELCRRLRAVFAAAEPRIPYAFFRLRYPIVLTDPLWRAAGRWYHALRPVEEQYFLRRHGVVLWGEDLRAEPRRAAIGPPSSAAPRSASPISATASGARSTTAGRSSSPICVAGRLPALWLVLARSRVATSPAEVLQGCLAEGFPHAAVLAELDRRLAGRVPEALPPVEDAAWRPAIDALTDWLDDLAKLALAAVRAPASQA